MMDAIAVIMGVVAATMAPNTTARITKATPMPMSSPLSRVSSDNFWKTLAPEAYPTRPARSSG